LFVRIAKKKLSLQIKEIDKGEIKEGTLFCKCGKKYKITKFIPRFVNTDSYVGNFSFEWKIHNKTQIDSANKNTLSKNTFIEKTGIDLKHLKNKLVLDVGCGTGRFMEVVHNAGAEIIGIDLSYAVDVAFDNFGLKKTVHIIQADVFNLPFKENTFDIIYSIGVLHHTVDTEKAFKHLPVLLKKNGRISIWVYDFQFPGYGTTRILNFYRKFTPHFPKKLLYALSHYAVLHKRLMKIPKIGIYFYKILPIAYHEDDRWAILDTYDMYSPLYQHKHHYDEVYRWFEDCGLKDIKLLKFPVSVTGVKK
jgi:ubiquinone/menaquinone biosynthesis C-methylase UbiE